MTKKMNVATATTTNSGKRNNSTNNTTSQMGMKNTKNEMAKSESVEYGTSAAKSVVVVGGQQVWRLVVNGVYYGCSNGSCDDKKLVVITDRKIGRNGVMVDYVQIEANEVIGYDDNYNAIYNFKCKKYHKRVKWMGNVDSTVRNEYVDGPNGVCALQVADMEKINKSKFWCYGAIAMDEETYNEWGEWLNNAGIGILAVMVGDEENAEENADNNVPETVNETTTVSDRAEWLKDNIAKAEAALENMAKEYGVKSYQFYDFGYGQWVIMHEDSMMKDSVCEADGDYEPIRDRHDRRRLTYINNVLESWTKELNELYIKADR